MPSGKSARHTEQQTKTLEMAQLLKSFHCVLPVGKDYDAEFLDFKKDITNPPAFIQCTYPDGCNHLGASEPRQSDQNKKHANRYEHQRVRPLAASVGTMSFNVTLQYFEDDVEAIFFGTWGNSQTLLRHVQSQ